MSQVSVPDWEYSLTGERTEVYGLDVLDSTEALLFTLTYQPTEFDPLTGDLVVPSDAGLTGGTVSFNLDGRIMSGCQLSLVNASGLIDWMSNRVRPWVMVNGQPWNLGVFLPSSPDDVHNADAVRQDVTLADKTSILDADATDSVMSIPAGAQVVPWVEQVILDSSGESVTGIVPSDKTLSAALTWPPGTSKLTVANDLLGSIAYNPLWCDAEGLWRSEEWVDPAVLAPTIVFAEGEAAIHSPAFTVSQNTTAVPNKVICTVQGDDSNPAMTSIATNTDPSSPYSYSARGGRWIPKSYDVEASDQATLDMIAAKYLKLNSTPPWYVSVSHAVTQLEGRQVLQFTSDGIDRQVSVNEWTVTMTPGALMTGKWLGVSS